MADMLLEEKYRPTNADEFIWINERVKSNFLKIIETDNFPNMILHSRQPGSGKTSTAQALVNLMKREYMFINFSLEGNIQTLKTKIDHFARTMSFNGKNKVIILDEIDSENAIAAKNFFNAFRPVIESTKENCRYIATCNNLDVIPDAIISRFDVYEYVPDDKKEFAKRILIRLKQILDLEGIEYNQKTIVDVIKKFMPDMRKILKFINQHRDELNNSDLVYSLTKGVIDKLFACLKENDFKTIKDVIINDIDDNSIYRVIYDGLKGNVDGSKIPSIIMCLADYMRYHNTVVDKQIHLMAMLFEISDIVKK